MAAVGVKFGQGAWDRGSTREKHRLRRDGKTGGPRQGRPVREGGIADARSARPSEKREGEAAASGEFNHRGISDQMFWLGLQQKKVARQDCPQGTRDRRRRTFKQRTPSF